MEWNRVRQFQQIAISVARARAIGGAIVMAIDMEIDTGINIGTAISMQQS